MSAEDEPGHRAALTRRDLMFFERRLRDCIAALFSFKSHSLHFPRTRNDCAPVLLEREKKLFLPIPDGKGGCLGVFTAGGVSKSPARLPALWPALSSLISDNLLLYKRGISDPVTGLFTRHYFLHCLERELEALRAPARPSPPAGGSMGRGDDGPARFSVGVLVARLAALRDVVRDAGYTFADELMTALADTLPGVCPEQALPARTGDAEFAVLLPSASPASCRGLSAAVVHAMRGVSLPHPLLREPVRMDLSVGYILYPGDMDGNVFSRPAAEQSRIVLRKARLAAALAGEHSPSRPGRADPEGVTGFGSILAEGGRVLENLPLSGVVVNLGTNVRAAEGQRFSVWAGGDGSGRPCPSRYKGEIAIMEVYEDVSRAEVIHLDDPARDIEAGDLLLLLPDEQGSRAGSGNREPDPETGLLRHGEFLARWAEERERAASFALVLLRLAPGNSPAPRRSGDEDEAAEARPDAPSPVRPEARMAEAARICRECFGPEAVGGRYSLNSLIFYHPFRDTERDGRCAAETLTAVCKKAVEEIENRLNLNAAAGIAPHPYLEFRKADALENSRKALEYALLLPKPHVGSLDSLALNISADKLFVQGDTFGAVREYRAALLADEKNGTAWNSLGVCLAGLSRHAEAETHFALALECKPGDAMVLYNLGYTHQSAGRADEARRCFQECLAADPAHLFALIRLGRLAESAGDTAGARDFYSRAARLPGGESPTRRHFARLCITEGNTGEAREHLHEALLYDPQDAAAMTMLAGIYLDAGEDPEIALSLARRSVSLRPDLGSARAQLARALEAAGKDKGK
jgi:Flp pilus assembly protein TadD/GGDEF domain-containing protein